MALALDDALGCARPLLTVAAETELHAITAAGDLTGDGTPDFLVGDSPAFVVSGSAFF